jgi:hypothetical protein
MNQRCELGTVRARNGTKKRVFVSAPGHLDSVSEFPGCDRPPRVLGGDKWWTSASRRCRLDRRAPVARCRVSFLAWRGGRALHILVRPHRPARLKGRGGRVRAAWSDSGSVRVSVDRLGYEGAGWWLA